MAITLAITPGDVVVCEEKVFRVGLSDTFSVFVIGYAHRTFSCELQRARTDISRGREPQRVEK